MKRSSDESGATMIEAMIVMCLLGFIVTTLTNFSTAILHNVRAYEAFSDAEQAARIAVQMLSRDIRGAGFSPDHSLNRAIDKAGVHRISLVSDLNGDGDSADSNERVAYSFVGAEGVLFRRQGNAPPQPFLEGLDEDGFQFEYFGGSGESVGNGEEELARDDLTSIRRIDIRVHFKIASAENTVPRGFTLDTTIVLRNG